MIDIPRHARSGLMQNYLIQNPIESFFHHTITAIKKRFSPKKRVPLKEQLTAEELITRLEYALNSEEAVTIQINDSLLSEEVSDLFGYVYQDNHGHVLLQSPSTHQFHKILPGTIRHITHQKRYSC